MTTHKIKLFKKRSLRVRNKLRRPATVNAGYLFIDPLRTFMRK